MENSKIVFLFTIPKQKDSQKRYFDFLLPILTCFNIRKQKINTYGDEKHITPKSFMEEKQ